MSRPERIAKVQRDLAQLRSRCQRIGSEAEMAVRDLRLLEAELAALKADMASGSEVFTTVGKTSGGQP